MIKTYLFSRGEMREGVSLDDWQSLVSDECALLWVDLRSFKDGELDDIAGKFGFHSVALDSCRDHYRRPHLYEFEDHFYVNMTTLRSGSRGHEEVKPAELHTFVGPKYIVTISRQASVLAVDAALEEMKAHAAACERGSIYAFYLLAEDLVETYYPVIEEMDNRADKLEEEMLDSADRSSVRKLFALKRSAFELRRFLGPQRDIFNELSRRDFPFITGENQVYFQDIYSRMIRLFDMVDTVREILSGGLDIYLSTISNRLNEVMKVLTIAAIILMTLSFITGFYGMNFVYLPGLKSPLAFWIISLVMAIIVLTMLWWFKRRKWM